MDASGCGRTRRFNPAAELVEATHGRVDPKRILGTGLFNLSQAERHPEWLKEARVGEHTPESVEYGISSITFRSRRPFHSGRFRDLTGIMETRTELVAHLDDGRGGRGERTMKRRKASSNSSSVTEGGRRAALQVVRAKGLVWIASQRSHWLQGMASWQPAFLSATVAQSQPPRTVARTSMRHLTRQVVWNRWRCVAASSHAAAAAAAAAAVGRSAH